MYYISIMILSFSPIFSKYGNTF